MDMFVGDALADGHVAFHPSQVSRDGVAGIEREELALDIGDQVVGRIHAGDFGHGALEGRALDVPFEEAFDDHVDRVLALDRRHDAVDRAVGEADVLLAPVTLGLVEVLEDSLPELCGGADAVFAGDDIERLGDAPAMRGSTVSPTAVVTSSAPAIWAASSGLRESIAEMSVMRICSQTVSMI